MSTSFTYQSVFAGIKEQKQALDAAPKSAQALGWQSLADHKGRTSSFCMQKLIQHVQQRDTPADIITRKINGDDSIIQGITQNNNSNGTSVRQCTQPQ